MNEDLLVKSKTVCKNPDAIVNLYDYCLVWISESLLNKLEYELSEVIDKSIINLFFGNDSKLRQVLIKVLSKTSMIKELTATTKNKNKLVMKVKFHNLNYDNTPFLVAKVLEFPER